MSNKNALIKLISSLRYDTPAKTLELICQVLLAKYLPYTSLLLFCQRRREVHVKGYVQIAETPPAASGHALARDAHDVVTLSHNIHRHCKLVSV